jgi:hypothetical protein
LGFSGDISFQISLQNGFEFVYKGQP